MPVRLICTSHSPMIDYAKSGLPEPDFAADFRSIFQKLKEQISIYDPNLIVIFAPDHFNGFYYDVMPPFCIGIEAEGAGDYDGATGTLNVASDQAIQLGNFLLTQRFDPAFSYRMRLDHGFMQPLSLLFDNPFSPEIIPIYINSVAPPCANYDRAAAFGKAVGNWLAQRDEKILIIGSGGLSHDPPVPDIGNVPAEAREYLIHGHNMGAEIARARQASVVERVRDFYLGRSDLLPLNPEWDKWVMEQFKAGDLSSLASLSTEEILAKAGRGGQEIRTWIAAFSALAYQGQYSTGISFYAPSNEWLVGMGVLSASSV